MFELENWYEEVDGCLQAIIEDEIERLNKKLKKVLDKYNKVWYNVVTS